MNNEQRKLMEQKVGALVCKKDYLEYLVIGASSWIIIDTLMKAGRKVTVIDIRSNRLRKIQDNFDSGPLTVKVLEGIEFASFRDEAFDAIVSYDVLHHFPQKENAIQEISRILCGGGGFYLFEPNISSKLLREYDQFGKLKDSMYKLKLIKLLKTYGLGAKNLSLFDILGYDKSESLTRRIVKSLLQRLEFDPLFRIYVSARKLEPSTRRFVSGAAQGSARE